MIMITTILFDLDGTLVPMDQDVFAKEYFTRIATYMTKYGYEPQKLIDTIWRGTGAMIKNNGTQTNEQAFWEVAESVYGEKIRKDKSHFDDFYLQEFDKIKEVCGFNQEASEIVYQLKKKGYRVVLATNPIFPQQATKWRIGWAGLKPDAFELYTTYENINYCKPNLAYYQEILKRMNVTPEECVMVGNDVDDDMIAIQIGMRAFLLTDCLINKGEKDISLYPHGTFSDFLDYLQMLNEE